MSKGRNEEELERVEKVERIDRSRRSVIDASTIASRSKSNRQNVHVRSSGILNTTRTK